MTHQIITPMFNYQFQNLTDVLEFLIADITEEEWLSRVANDNNRIGFLAWHVPVIQDFTVNTLIRGVPEVRTRAEWQRSSNLDTTTLPFGMPLAEADSVAEISHPATVLDYANDVRTEILGWFNTVDEADLTAVPNIHAHLTQSPVYRDVTFSEELNPAFGSPAWALMLAACFGHLRSHLGEIEAVKRQIRQNQFVPA